MGHKLAIDFGTTNSVVARWSGGAGAADFVFTPGLNADFDDERRLLIPSLLYVHNGCSNQISIGQAVRDHLLDRRRDNRLFRNFKRGITAGANLTPRLIDGVPWTDQEAGEHFMRGLMAAIPYAATDVEELILTVPVMAVEGYAAWLSQAIQGFPPELIRIVDEPTAAALGYAITQPQALVLVFDFGGGTLDLSLVQLPESREKTGGFLQRLLTGGARQHTARVLAKAGQPLGGSDVDQWLLAEMLQRTHLSALDLGGDYTALLTACEAAKIELSTAEAAQVSFDAGSGRSYSVPFDRVELEVLLEKQGFYTALCQAIDKLMYAAQRRGIFKEDIHHVLMVGGMSLVPSVQATLKSYFDETTIRVGKPFTAIAEGALQVAAGLGLEDYLAHSYGLRYLDPGTGRHHYDEIIPMGSRYPTSKSTKVLLGAAHPAQAAVEFVIGQIDTDAVSMVEVKYEGDQAVFVAQADHLAQTIVPLNPQPALAPLSPPGVPGEGRLEAHFSVDVQRRLRLSVTDLKTRKKVLDDVALVRLEEEQSPTGGDERSQERLTRLEPRLVSYRMQPGQYRLSLRGLASMVNLLPPESISLEAAAAALHSTEFFVRYCAAELLSRRGDRDARMILEDALLHGPGTVRASAAHHLHRLSWFVAEPLLRQALQDPDPRVHVSAMYALCEVRSADGYQLMLEALPHESDQVRLAAVWGLWYNLDRKALPVLELVMQSQDTQVRERALEALGAIGVPLAIPIVRQALDDRDLDVKYAAALSLVELAREDCFDELASLIAGTAGAVRRCFLRGLFHAANYLQIDLAKSAAAEHVVDALEAAMHDESSEVRMAAALPLAWLRHERAAAALLEGYRRESDGETKAQLLHIGVSLASPAGAAMLAEALDSDETPVREAADYLVHHCPPPAVA